MCILLVEDEFLVRDVGQMFLRECGFDVLAAEDGQQAFEHLETFPGRFSCLVTDYSMRGDVTGAHVIRQMRSSYPAIPMILATAGPLKVTPMFLRVHRVALLPKPYELEELAKLIRSLAA